MIESRRRMRGPSRIGGGPSRVAGRLRAFLADSGGNATLEFIILAPFLFYMLFSISEIGLLMTREAMLERGLRVAMRDLRLGAIPNPTPEEIKRRICDAAFLLSSCEEVLMLELTPLPNAASYPTEQVRCVDRTSDVQPVVTFDPGAPSEIMLVRACIVVDPLFPGTGLGAMLPKDASGGYALMARSAFVNEPDKGA